MKIGLTYDLRQEYLALGFREADVAEFDSVETIDALNAAIRSLGHTVERIGMARNLCRRLAAGERWDLVFNIAEGMGGRFRESQVPCLLELYGVPYTFSDPFACALTLDKSLAKRLVAAAGLRTPAFHVVRSAGDIEQVRLGYPLFAKPLAEGTGKGIDVDSCVETPEQLDRVCGRLLAQAGQPVLVEEYLPGREFTVGILGTGAAARAIGTLEIEVLDPALKGVYSYDAKERCEKIVRYSTPPAGGLREDIEAVAVASHRALECRDASRADVRLDAEGRPSFMEINPLPGLHPSHSDLPMIATAAGIPYAALIRAIVDSAAARRHTLAFPEAPAAGR